MGTEQQQERTEKPEVTEEHKETAKEMAKAYDEDRPTSTLPGSGGTVSGTAVTDWVDEPNGLAFSPDESILYVADTSLASHDDGGGNHHLAAFDVVDGRTLANPRVFYTVDEWVPDGFRIDVDGNVWTSADDGIHVVAPDGRRLGRLPVPERTANCVFGGPGLDRLFITATTSLYMIDVAARGVVPAGRP